MASYEDQDVHHETMHRYRNDVEFRAMVELLRFAALKNGFTPYELKQIAYCAALVNEMETVRDFGTGKPR